MIAQITNYYDGDFISRSALPLRQMTSNLVIRPTLRAFVITSRIELSLSRRSTTWKREAG